MHNTGFFPDCQLLSVTDGSIWIPYLTRYSEIFKKPNFHFFRKSGKIGGKTPISNTTAQERE